MPLLAALIAKLFAALVSFFAIWLTKRIAVIVAVVAAFVALTATMITSINALFSAVLLTFPSTLTTAASWVVPSNLGTCLGTYMAALVLRWAYDINTKVIQMKLV